MKKLQTRVIPILLLKNKGFYKGVKFKNHQYIGDPINTVKLFNEKYVDELIILDIEATKNNKIDFELLQEIAGEAFMPMGYGGGVKCIEDVRKLFSIGFEKVVLNTVCYDDNYSLAKKIVEEFGSQSLVVCVDVKKKINKYVCFSNSGKKKEKILLEKHISNLLNVGIGEILISDILYDGMMNGYNLSLIKKISENLPIPLIASCGAGSLNDMFDAKYCGANACAAGSMFVYKGKQRGILINYPEYSKLLTILGEEV